MKTTTTPSCDANPAQAKNPISDFVPTSGDEGDDLPVSADFVLTRFELELLARHWLQTHLEVDLMYFLDRQTGSTESGLDRLAEERMDEIREAFGEPHFQELTADLEWHLTNALSLRPGGSQPVRSVENIHQLAFPDDCDRLGSDFDTKTIVHPGTVDEVNGAGGALTAGFAPTLFELEIIASHWLFTHLDMAYYCHIMKQSGSTEWLLIHYSDRRLARLRTALGDERYLKVCAAVDAEFEQRFGKDEWRSFRTPEK